MVNVITFDPSGDHVINLSSGARSSVEDDSIANTSTGRMCSVYDCRSTF